MSKLDYRHIDLDGATLVQRSHKRQVTPPGMWSVENMYLSRSDNNPTLRPDLTSWGQEIYAISDDLVLPTTNSNPDIVNTVSGIYGSADLVYFTSYIPWAKISGGFGIASDTFSTGDVTGSANSYTVNFANLGGTIDLHHKAWRGSILKILTKYYVIDQVIASSAAAHTGTVILTTPLEDTHVAEAYTLYYNHNANRAAHHKIQVQQNGGYMIYATPSISTDVKAEDISGPFQALTSEDNWEYGIAQHTQTDAEFSHGVGNIPWAAARYTLATNGTKWIRIPGLPLGSADTDAGYWEATEIEGDSPWTAIDASHGEGAGNPWSFHSIRRNSTLGFLCVGSRDPANYGQAGDPIVMWSGDSGATWTSADITGYSGPGSVAIDAEYDGTTLTVLMYTASTTTVNIIYSTNLGSTWNNATGVASYSDDEFTTPLSKIKIVNGNFVVCSGSEYIYHSADGQAFSSKDISSDEAAMIHCFDIAYNNGDGGSDVYAVTSSAAIAGAYAMATAATLGGTYTETTPSWLDDLYPYLPFIHYDVPAARFLVATLYSLVSSLDYGATWRSSQWTTSSYPSRAGFLNLYSNFDWSGDIIAIFRRVGDFTVSPPDPTIWFTLDRSFITSWKFTGNGFSNISDIYRANSVAVLEGYTVLVGTREYESLAWVYHPRRIRWSVAGSPIDFSGTGSGTGDVRGFGALLTSVVVNGRIVIFETVAVSAMVPRGESTDPWDYDVIDEHFRFLSNPIAVGDVCYVVSTDGLLYTTDGISELQELGASFDLHEFDDFDESSPVWLVFSEEFNSIMCYYKDTSGTTHPAYMVSVANGGVSEIPLPHMDDNDDQFVETPGSIIAIENSSDQALMISAGPDSSYNDQIILSNYGVENPITGVDVPFSPLGTVVQSDYWSALLETGELYITEEGTKCSVKHFLVETYTKSSVSGATAQPYLTAEVKSIEDSDFVTPGDTVGTATMTTSALTGVGTAWSNTIADGDDITDTFTLPCQGKQARVYIDSTLQVSGTDYTISGNDITLSAVLATGTVLYAYWDAYPEVKVKVGDLFKSSEGWHRVTAITSAAEATVDHYLSTGSETVTHYPAWQLDDGHGRTEIGINRLVEGVQIRLYIIPEYNSVYQPEIVKITGLSIGYVPQGRKILKATGS